MKKLVLFLVLTVITTIQTTTYAWNSNVIFSIDGKISEYNFDVMPIEKDGYLYLTLRGFAEMFNLYVSWDDSTQSATFSDYLTMTLDSDSAKLSTGEKIVLPSGCRLLTVYDRTLCPMEFVANQFGYKVTYDSDKSLIVATTDEEIVIPEITEYTIYDITLTDFSGNHLDNIPDVGKFLCNIEVKKNFSASSSASIIIATYSKNNELLDYNIMSGSFATGQTLNFSTTLTQQGDLYRIKAFVWDSLKGCTPLSNNKSLVKN